MNLAELNENVTSELSEELSRSIMPNDLPEITTENANSITELFQFGKGEIRTLAWSPNNEIVAIGTTLGVVIYDIESWAEIQYMDVGKVEKLEFTRSGNHLIADQKIWDTSTWARTDTVSWNSYQISPNSDLIVNNPDDNSLELVVIEEGKITEPLFIFEIRQAELITFSQDGSLIAARDENRSVHIWQVKNGEKVWQLDDLPPSLEKIQFIANSAVAITIKGSPGSFDIEGDPIEGDPGEVSIWSIPDGELLALHSGDIINAFVSPTEDLYTLITTEETHIPQEDNPDSYKYVDEHSMKIMELVDGQIQEFLNPDWHTTEVAYSPDGTTLAIRAENEWNYDDTFLINSKNGNQIHKLKSETSEDTLNVYDLSFSHDGNYLAGLNHNGTELYIWEVSSGEFIKTITGFLSSFPGVVVSPDSKSLIVGADASYVIDLVSGEIQSYWSWGKPELLTDNKIILGLDDSHNFGSYYFIIDLEKDAFEQIEWQGDWEISSHALSPAGDLIAIGTWDGELIFADPLTGLVIQQFTPEVDRFDDLDFSPDSRYLAGISERHDLLVWDLEAQNDISFSTSFEGKFRGQVRFSPDSSYLAISLEERSIVYQSQSWQILHEFPTNNVSLTFSPDSQMLMVDNRAYSMLSGELLFEIRGAGSVFSPSGDLILATDSLWSGANGDLLYKFEEPGLGHGFSFSPDSKFIVSTLMDGGVKIWGIGEKVADVNEWEVGGNVAGEIFLPKPNDLVKIREFSFSPDGNYLGSIDDDNLIHIWDVQDNSILQTIEVPNTEEFPRYTDLDISHNGRFVALISQAAELGYVWEIASGVLVFTTPPQAFQIEFLNNSELMVIASKDGSLSIWDTSLGNKIGETRFGGDNDIRALHADHIRNRLGVVTDKEISLWEFTNNQLEKVFEFPRNLFSADFAFSGNGDLIFPFFDFETGEQGIKIWDIEADNEINDLGSDSAFDLFASPNGRWLITHTEEGHPLWDLESNSVINNFADYQRCIVSNDYLACLDGNALLLIALDG